MMTESLSANTVIPTERSIGQPQDLGYEEDVSGLITTSKEPLEVFESEIKVHLKPTSTPGPTTTDTLEPERALEDAEIDEPPPETHDLQRFFGILNKIKREWSIKWQSRTTIQCCTKHNHIVTNLPGLYVIGVISTLTLITFVVVGIITTRKDISTAALGIVGACWLIAGCCLTAGGIEMEDNWDSISSRFWENLLSLFAVGSGLVFGKWVSSHE